MKGLKFLKRKTEETGTEQSVRVSGNGLPMRIELEQRLRKNIFEALQGPVVEELIRIADSGDSATYFRSVMEGHSLKVEKSLLEHLYDLFEQTKAALGYTDPIDFYVTGSSDVNAFSVSIENDDKPSIVNVNSALISLMTDDEIKFVIGHEIGHLIDHDSKLNTLISFVYPDTTKMPVGLQHKVRLWEQLAELEADRYGYEACGDLGACVSAFYKMSSGLDLARMGVKLEVLLEENRKHLEFFISDKGLSLDTHPVNPIRVESINLFATCGSEKELDSRMSGLIDTLLRLGCSEIDKPMSDFIACAGLLAASADGALNSDEEEMILEELSDQQIFAKEYLETIKKSDIEKIFSESVQKIMEVEPGLREPMMRYIVELTLADNKLAEEELAFIFEFGEKILGYSKKECAVMLAQHIQLGFTPDITKLELN